jgi:hypothetical protein
MYCAIGENNLGVKALDQRTNSVGSQIFFCVMTVLFVDRGAAEQVESITAGMALCQALVISVASRMKKRSAAVLNEIDSMEKFALSPAVSVGEKE